MKDGDKGDGKAAASAAPAPPLADIVSWFPFPRSTLARFDKPQACVFAAAIQYDDRAEQEDASGVPRIDRGKPAAAPIDCNVSAEVCLCCLSFQASRRCWCVQIDAVQWAEAAAPKFDQLFVAPDARPAVSNSKPDGIHLFVAL